MTTIYKYPIEITQRQQVDLPAGAKILTADLDPAGTPCIWAQVNPAVTEREKRMIWILGTAHQLSDLDGINYLNTFRQGPFVWHVFV